MKSHDLFAGRSVNHIGEKKCLFLGVMYKMEYFRENLHTKQKIPRESLHQLRWSPSPLGEGNRRQAVEGFPRGIFCFTC